MSRFDTAFTEAMPWCRYQDAGKLMLPLDRAKGLWEAAERCLELDGEFWECGVYKGGSAKILVDLLRPKPRPLRLFDTFRGFSGTGAHDRNEVEDGRMFYSDKAIEEIRNFLRADFCSFHPGAIPKGFSGLEHSRIAFANIDVDLYQPTRVALAFVMSRMVPGGVIIVDDYDDPDWPGVTKAVNELLGAVNFRSSGTQARIDF